MSLAGTSKAFYADPTVLYVSLHGSPDYPCTRDFVDFASNTKRLLDHRHKDFTGAVTERGSGPGVGTNMNYPLPLGTGNEAYLETLGIAAQAIRDWVPQFLVVS